MFLHTDNKSLSAFGCLKVVYNDSQAKLATKYDSRQCRYEIGLRFSSFVFRHSFFVTPFPSGGRLRGASVTRDGAGMRLLLGMGLGEASQCCLLNHPKGRGSERARERERTLVNIKNVSLTEGK